MKFIKKHIKKLRLRTLISLGLLLIILPVIAFTLFAPSSITATWYNDHYAYRQRFEFTHNASITSPRKVTFTLDTAELITDGVMQSDCDDTRFTDSNGKELKYDLTGTCNNASTTYEVIFPTVLNATQYAYVYYGNPIATNAEIDSTSYTALTPSGGDPSAITDRTAESQAPSPTVYLSFDENADNTCTDGTDACDSTSNANNATFAATTESPTWVDPSQCIKGSCLYFDGTDDYTAIESATSLDMSETTSMTIAAWIKTNSTGSFQNIFRYDDCDTADGDSSCGIGRDIYYVRLGTANKLQFGYGDTGTGLSSIASNATIEPNKWYYIVAVRDVASDTEKIYINGVLDNSETDTTTGTWVTSGQYPVIGHYPSEEYGGLVDELKVYNYARTADEIKQDFAVGGSGIGSSAVLGSIDMSPLSDGLIGYWPMDDRVSGDAQTISDATGNGYDGSTNGAGVDCTVEGKFGLGCDLDNAESIDVTDNDVFSINNTNELTASAWITPGTINAHSAFSKGSSGNYEWSLGYDSSGYFIASIYTSTGSVYMRVTATTDAITAGETAHISMSANLTESTLYLYKNGELLGTDTTASGTYTNGTAGLEIGELAFDGVIDDARVYNRALSSSEIAQLYNLAPGPVAYFNLDENTGTSSVHDRSGNDLANTRNGTMTESDWVPGRYGSGLDFDGNDDSVSITNTDAIDFDTGLSKSFTFAMWFYARSDGESNQGQIFVKGNNRCDTRSETGGNVTIACNIATPSSIFEIESGISLNTWHHLALVFVEDTIEGHVYIDGRYTGSDPGTGDLTSDTDNFFIGGNTSQNFDGLIDEVRIYNYAVTQTQVIEMMNAGHPIGGSPLGSQNVYYKFDEGYGTTANNSVITHQSVTGTVSGATITTSGCKYNNCLDFDGSNDVVTVANTSAIDLDGGIFEGFSFATWFNTDSDGENNVGQIFQKGTNTYCRTDNESGGSTDLECSVDFITTDANVNISAAVTIGQWHHLGLVVDKNTATIYVYLDGVLRGSNTGSGAMELDSNSMLIGGTTTANFDGTIDDFKFYSAILTSSQVEVDMNANAAVNFGTGTIETDNYVDTFASPVAYWNLDENTGTSTTNDITSNAYTGTLTSIITSSWVPGKYGSGLDLDGSADYIDVGTGPTTVRSVSFWVNPATTTEYFVNLTSTTDYISASAGTVSATGFSTPTIYVNGQISSTITAGTWQHIVVTTATAENASNLDIGRTQDTNYLDGVIDEVMLFDSQLTQAQVAYLYNQGEPVAHWKLDDCQGTTAYDSSVNGLNGTVSIGGSGGNTTPGTCSGSAGEAWNDGESGKFNSALEFDGTDDYITMSDSSILSPGAGNFTVSAWYKTSTDFSTSGWIYQDFGSVSNNEIALGMSEFDAITCIYQDGSANLAQASHSVTSNDGNWHLATCVRDGTSANLYIDGILAQTNTNGSLGTINTTGDDQAIGTNSASNGTQNFTGIIDDVRVYNYDLSPTQIKQLYNGGAIRFGPETGSP